MTSTSSENREPGFAWPAQGAGLRIGDAAALLDTTVKAIRTYHERGLVPEPERDESGYRRYDARTLVRLARVIRLRDVGLPLRAIAPIVAAPEADAGAALRSTLEGLREQLEEELAELRRRRALVGALLAEGIDDPLEVSAVDVAEERQIALLRAAIPDVSPEHEAFERRMQRALAALGVIGADDDAVADARIERDLLDAAGGLPALADRSRRLFALRDADPDDPRVAAFAAEMRAVFEAATAQALARVPAAGDAPGAAPVDAEPGDVERFAAGLSAALSTLPPAVRRVWELTFGLEPAARER